MKRWIPVLLLAAVTGCAVPYDDDGQGFAPADYAAMPAPAPSPDADATPVVFDTDLAPDDLVALTFLLRRTDVSVEAVTIAATGLVGCDPGVELVANLLAVLDEPSVPIACGRAEPGPGGHEWPSDWAMQAAAARGLPRPVADAHEVAETAPELIGRLADRHQGALTVVAVGPLTNLADLAAQAPASYARIAMVQVMGGAVDVPDVDGIAEWNAAADPEAFAAVLAEEVPLTIVPDDPIPAGTPPALDAPVVGPIARAITYPKWWDTTTVAALVTPGAVTSESGTWEVDDSGRLTRTGPGSVLVVTALDEAALAPVLEATFG
ncbi:nucleoside hydrolase [Nocardioides sp. SR21]|uniref:nucleoside hydrolase n=1 Tax=Nocardioides sp. SR21 TaxID=2919501 RepID=UPI001FA95659|nr:nucleoside hydrolase [Nocardioides sp. SR21]